MSIIKETKAVKTSNFLASNALVAAVVVLAGTLPLNGALNVALVYASYAVIFADSITLLMMVLLVNRIVKVEALKQELSLILLEMHMHYLERGKQPELLTIKSAAQFRLNNLPNPALIILVQAVVLGTMVTLKLPYVLQLTYLVMVLGGITVGHALRTNLKVIINE